MSAKGTSVPCRSRSRSGVRVIVVLLQIGSKVTWTSGVATVPSLLGQDDHSTPCVLEGLHVVWSKHQRAVGGAHVVGHTDMEGLKSVVRHAV